MMENNRNEFVDLAKGVLMFLVTLGHTVQGFIGGGGYGDFFMNHLFRFIYSFHMPAFMTISGFFFYFSYKKRKGRAMIIHKILTILLPVISWNALGYLFLYIPGNIHKMTSLEAIIKSMLSYATLWFLVSVFLNSVLVVAFMEVDRRIHMKWIHRSVLILIGVLFLFFFPYGEQYIFMIPYFIAGYMLAERKITLSDPKISKVEIAVSILFMVMLYFYTKEDYIYTTGIYVLRSEKQIWIDIYRWAIGASGTVFFLLCVKLFNRLKKSTWLRDVLIRGGRNTLVIYAIQTLVLFRVTGMLGAFLSGRLALLESSEFLLNIICFCTAVILNYLMTILAELLRRNRITGLLFCGTGRI